LLESLVRKTVLSSLLVLKLLVHVKKLDEKEIYTAKEIPDIPIKEEFREKQRHREEAIELMLKMIELIY
jgi:hypothetical protein